MPRSEASRQRDRDRVRKWRHNNPEKARANNRRAWKKWTAKHVRLSPRIASKLADELYQHGLSIVNPKRSPILFIDKNGNVHTERECTAEELIRRYQAQQRKGKP